MTNQEIRAKALRLYRTHFIGLFLLALCYSGIYEFVNQIGPSGLQEQSAIAGAGLIFYVNIDIFHIVAYLLLAPLGLGAALCMAHLWRTETSPHYADLTTFYRSIQGWGRAILLRLLQGGTILLPLLVPIAMSMSLPILLFHTTLITVVIFLSFLVIVWLWLRIYMAEVLFISEEDISAWKAIQDSFFRMSGQVGSLLCMMLAVNFVPVIVSLIAMVMQPAGIGVQIAVWVFRAIYTPFSFAASIGWVIEHLNDEEQPEEAAGPPKDPVLRQIASDLGKDGKQPGMEDRT